MDEWETFHRRPMLESLARNAEGVADLLCVALPFALPVRPAYWGRGISAWRHSREGIRRVSDNLHLFTPASWLPSLAGKTAWGQSVLQRLLRGQVLSAIGRLGMAERSRVAWVFRPEQLGMLGLANEQGVVYECHDEYRVDKKTGQSLPDIECMEMALLQRADIVFATSESLRVKRAAWHSQVHLAPNGVDVELFGKALASDVSVVSRLEPIKRPIIGYPGHLAEFVDTELIETVANMRPDWSLVLLGEVRGRVSVSRIRKLRNVHLLGPQPRELLPSFSKCFDVVLLPFRVNEYLHCSVPLTLLEQLAAGKLVVSTDLREIRNFQSAVFLARDAKGFVRAIELALSGDHEERIQRGRDIASSYAWDRVTKRSLDLILSRFGAGRQASTANASLSVIG